MRPRLMLLAVAVPCALMAAACEPSEPSLNQAKRPERFSFEETALLLEERNILLRPLEYRPGLVDPASFERMLRRRMQRHPSWEILSVHLAEMDLPNPHFEIYDQPTYVVEVTGPSTGNCFDFHLASTGRYEGGACFYPRRS